MRERREGERSVARQRGTSHHEDVLVCRHWLRHEIACLELIDREADLDPIERGPQGARDVRKRWHLRRDHVVELQKALADAVDHDAGGLVERDDARGRSPEREVDEREPARIARAAATRDRGSLGERVAQGCPVHAIVERERPTAEAIAAE